MYVATKRTVDALGALLLLMGLFPLLAGAAVAIWLVDGRPIFFSQSRIGRNGVPFRIVKLRTLKTGPKDPTRPAAHTTRIGPFLRRWAIDELPQLWNVLWGDMSLVGPRPALPEQGRTYGPRERIRLRVRPGLTGWAQIHGRNALSWPERIDHDLWYVRNRHLGIDLFILARTPAILIRGIGVYGPDGRTASFPSSTDTHA